LLYAIPPLPFLLTLTPTEGLDTYVLVVELIYCDVETIEILRVTDLASL
jgi:hypothetical protein